MNPDWEKNDTPGEKYTGWRSLWISGNQNVLFLKEVEFFLNAEFPCAHHTTVSIIQYCRLCAHYEIRIKENIFIGTLSFS